MLEAYPWTGRKPGLRSDPNCVYQTAVFRIHRCCWGILLRARGFESLTPCAQGKLTNAMWLARLARLCVLYPGFRPYSDVIGPKSDPSLTIYRTTYQRGICRRLHSKPDCWC